MDQATLLTTLLARRSAVIERFKVMESVPQSPWSPDHPLMQAAMREGQILGSLRPVCLIDDARRYFVGPDVATVLDACRKFVATKSPDETLAAVPQQAAIVCQMLLDDHFESAPNVLRMTNQEFNHVMVAMTAAGFQVASTGVRD